MATTSCWRCRNWCCPGVDPERVVAAMALDKKVLGETIRWVLLEDVGCAVVRSDVPEALVQSVLQDLSRRTG